VGGDEFNVCPDCGKRTGEWACVGAMKGDLFDFKTNPPKFVMSAKMEEAAETRATIAKIAEERKISMAEAATFLPRGEPDYNFYICGDGRFVRPTESSDPSAIPYSIASPAAQACWPRLKGNEEKGSTKAGDKVSDKGGNNCSQSKDSTKALGQPSRLDLIIAKVRDAILMVQHLMPLFDNTDTSARAEAQLAISRLESLEAKFVRKQRKAA
jgi:hypothetical protein